MKPENQIYKEAFKQFVLLCLAIVACRYSKGAFCALLVFVGCWAALTNRLAMALSLYAFFPLLVVLNPNLLPKTSPLFSLAVRFGPLLMGICLMLVSSRRTGRYRLPLGGLFVYLIWSIVPSCVGYFPEISYFKIINFAVFLIGLWYGTQNLQNYPRELFKIRAFFFAVVVFFVVGSMILYPFPGISTLDGLMITNGEDAVDAEYATELLMERGGQRLFCGVTYQSQSLAGVVGCCFGWTVCDMLMVEKKLRWPHLLLIGAMPIVIFMTRSRMGLVILLAFVVIAYGYTIKRIRVSPRIKQRINGLAITGLVLGLIGMGVAEVANDSISRWLRKTDDVTEDRRSLTEAVTSSRMGLVEKNLADFNRNPLIGSGFQVDVTHQVTFKGRKGLILSAPIEKGLLPLMIIGETGVVGGLFFLVFLIVFCNGCIKMRFMATLTLFWVLFASNIGEATFFSPGGPGGVEWMLTVFGGFIIDMFLHAQQRQMAFYDPHNFRGY